MRCEGVRGAAAWLVRSHGGVARSDVVETVDAVCGQGREFSVLGHSLGMPPAPDTSIEHAGTHAVHS